jgi:hypothetical protein
MDLNRTIKVDFGPDPGSEAARREQLAKAAAAEMAAVYIRSARDCARAQLREAIALRDAVGRLVTAAEAAKADATTPKPAPVIKRDVVEKSDVRVFFHVGATKIDICS